MGSTKQLNMPQMSLTSYVDYLSECCLLTMQGQQRKSALLEYFHATGKAKIKAVVYVCRCCFSDCWFVRLLAVVTLITHRHRLVVVFLINLS